MKLELRQKRELVTVKEGAEVRTLENADYALVENGNEVGSVNVYPSGINISLNSPKLKVENLSEEALQEFINSLI